jgi:hypothetical protein
MIDKRVYDYQFSWKAIFESSPYFISAFIILYEVLK